MSITVPPIDTPSNVVSAEATPTGPSSGNHHRDLPDQVKQALAQASHYFTLVVEDVIKPSIATFLETCDTNPRVAVIVATPALLAFLLASAFFVFSTLVLILWSVLTITTGVLFVVVGGLLSLFFKLLFVLLATVPMAGFAAALLVGANAASQFILNKASGLGLGRVVANTGVSRAVRQTDWTQITEMVATFGKTVAQGVRDATPVLMAVRDAFVTIGLALHSTLQNTLLALHKYDEFITSSSEVRQEESPAAAKREDGEYSPILVDSELDPGAVERVSSSGESSAEGLKRRAPFPSLGDEGEQPN